MPILVIAEPEKTSEPQPKARSGRPLILHGRWYTVEQAFHIWGEGERPSRKQRAGKTRPRPHPFAASAEDLARETGLSAGVGTALLRLPGTEEEPAPSPEWIRHNGADELPAAVGLFDWRVPALLVSPLSALEWLSNTSPDALGSGGTDVEGADLGFWRAAARFALGLLRRERYFPVLERGPDGGLFGRWRSAINQPADAARFRELAAALPDAARTAGGEEGTPGASRVLTEFIRAGVDAAVRAWGRDEAPSLPADAAATRAWLRALFTEDGRLAERPENLRPLFAAVGTWSQPILSAAEAGFRTCFRLDPPALEGGPETPWLLSYWLQAIDEPSMLVPAGEVWSAGGKSLAALGRRWDSPQEKMLPALARAARLFPPINASLRSRAPTEAEASTPEAYHFLREVAPLLEETGCGVLTPDWWRKPAARLGLRARVSAAPASATSGVLTQDRLMQFDWSLAIGDEPLTPEEFAELAALKTPLVRLRGRWLEVRPDEIERAIQAWERRRGMEDGTILDALRLASGEEDGVPLTGIEMVGELRTLLDQFSGDQRPDPVELPAGFHGVLRPYQQFGLEWLSFLRAWKLGACLADDMGLGKTIQVLAYLLHVRREKAAATGAEAAVAVPRAPVLLVCPTSLVENWRREALKFSPSLRVYIHHGASRARGEATPESSAAALGNDPSDPTDPTDTPPAVPADRASPPPFIAAIADHDLVVTTYQLALRDADALRSVVWDTVILDEAQNIKNPGARQSRAVRSLPAGSRIAMTGTPVENRLSDLWSIMEFLNPGFLGPERVFRGKYATPIERDRDPVATERLRLLTQPFLLRRVKTDPTVIRDLPEKQEMKVICTLTSEQATLYEAVVQEMIEQIDSAEGIQRRGLVLSVLTRLKQVCNHPAQLLHDESALAGRSGKLQRLVEMLEEVFAVGEAALIFTQFAEFGGLLAKHLETVFKREVLFLYGGVPRKQRDTMVSRFQAPEGPPLMLLSLKAGGVGLNLTRANHVFHFDRWWNPAVENQATDRAFRIGQTRAVQVHKFLCAGTLEDHIDTMIEQKQDLARSIVGAGENWLTELSTGQLRELLTLRA